ncbi:MAG TPA: hypothetical protein VKA26_11075 [Ignavibacteriaceae bacterium]|nr:hypothetical protein [Ignavibacteriaceae bacterium]
MHLFSIPFSGALLTGFAVIIISVIAYFSESKWEILKSTLIVIIVKLAVSPHTPATAYLAVFLQGLLGEFLFLSKRFFKISSMMFGIFAMLFTAIQRIIILTIVFGNTLWNSIDIYSSHIINRIYSNPGSEVIHLSYYIIGIYISLHFLLGLIAGYWAGKMPVWIIELNKSGRYSKMELEFDEPSLPDIKKGKKKWWMKKSFQILFLLVLALVIFSYYEPSIGKDVGINLLTMLLRSLIILFIWYSLISPAVTKILNNFLNKRKIVYIDRVDNILNTLPQLKKTAEISWQLSMKEKGAKRLKIFITSCIFFTLFK